MVHVRQHAARPHALKAGADIRFLREVGMNYGNSAGTYTFGTQWTRGPLDNAAGSPHGQALASFLLGLPTAGGFDVESQVDARSTSAAFFFQDDWRATSELTLNLGLRYQLETGTTEKNNGLVVGFDRGGGKPGHLGREGSLRGQPASGLSGQRVRPDGRAGVRERRQPSGISHAAQPVVAAHRRRLYAWHARAEHGVSRRLRRLLPHLRHHRRQPAGVCADDRVRPHQRRVSAAVRDPVESVSKRDSQPVGSSLGVDQSLGQAVTYYNPDTRRATRDAKWRPATAAAGAMALRASYQYSQSRGLPINDNSISFPQST